MAQSLHRATTEQTDIPEGDKDGDRKEEAQVEGPRAGEGRRLTKTRTAVNMDTIVTSVERRAIAFSIVSQADGADVTMEAMRNRQTNRSIV